MKNKNKKKIKKGALFLLPLLIIYYISSIYFSCEIFYYNSTLSVVTYLVYGALFLTCLLMVIFTVSVFKSIKKNKTKKYVILSIILIVIICIQVFVTFNLNKVSSSIKKVTSNFDTYETSLIVMNSSNYNSINDLNQEKIGIISDTENIEGYVIAKEIIDDEKINTKNLEYYDDFPTMLSDLYNGNIKAAFVSSNYASMFSNLNDFEDINSKVKSIKKKTKVVKKKKNTTKKTLTEPFTVLILGVDSESGSLSKSSSLNGDTIMLITFNPKTSNATILSIPRDTYTQITCNKNRLNKINSAAYSGTDCMINTVKKLTGIDIDYWVKINFAGAVSLVDALGGVDIDVPYSFCEQDSKRRFGKYTIYIEKGRQTLNGEQALAFARNRHAWPQYCGKKYSNYVSNDFIRGQNQQQIVNACLNKLKNINRFSQVYSLLDVVGYNIDTNIEKDTMITGFDTFTTLLKNSKNINSEDFIGTQRLYLSGYDSYINKIYYFKYSEQSLKEITDAMKINLGIKEPKLYKDFEFSINSPYEDKQIGKGTYKY